MRCISLTQTFSKYPFHSSHTSAIRPIHQASDCFKIYLASKMSISLHGAASLTLPCFQQRDHDRKQSWLEIKSCGEKDQKEGRGSKQVADIGFLE